MKKKIPLFEKNKHQIIRTYSHFSVFKKYNNRWDSAGAHLVFRETNRPDRYEVVGKIRTQIIITRVYFRAAAIVKLIKQISTITISQRKAQRNLWKFRAGRLFLVAYLSWSRNKTMYARTLNQRSREHQLQRLQRNTNTRVTTLPQARN